MTIGELSTIIAEGKADPSTTIYMASDAEGNAFHNINEITNESGGVLMLWPKHDHINLVEHSV